MAALSRRSLALVVALALATATAVLGQGPGSSAAAPAAPGASAAPAPAPAPAEAAAAAPVADSTRLVSTALEMHAALTTESVTHIQLKNNITMSLESCPPGSAIYMMQRDVTVTTAPGAPVAWFDCALLPTRGVLNRTLTFTRVGVINCYTDSVMGYVRMLDGGRIVFDRAIQHPTLCASPEAFLSAALHLPRPSSDPGTQRMREAPPGWCSDPQFASVAQATGAPSVDDGSVCASSATILFDVVTREAVVSTNADSGVIVAYRNSVLLCSDPHRLVTHCGRSPDIRGCVADAYAAINPDRPYYEALAAADAARRRRVAAAVGGAIGGFFGALLLAAAALLLIRRRRRRRLVWARSVAGIPPKLDPEEGGGGGGGGGGFGAGAPAVAPDGPSRHCTGDRSRSRSARSGRGVASRTVGGPDTSDGARPLLRPDGIQLGVLMGAGSTGRVYAGRWNGRLVAVKVITHSALDEPLIERELKLSMTFKHPNVTAALFYTKTKLNHSVDPTPEWARTDDVSGTDGGATAAGPGTPSPLSNASPPHAAEATAISDEGTSREERAAGTGRGSVEASADGAGAGGGGTAAGGAGVKERAVGVFSNVDLPPHNPTVPGARQVDTETYIVMELSDQGTLAGAVHAGRMLKPSAAKDPLAGAPGDVEWRAVLLRARDAAAGLSYLHSRGVVHADVKADNVLLATDPGDPYMLRGRVADFGLSRALLAGQTHETTRHFGTVTHQPPELLSRGVLHPKGDVYSFGIMLWSLVHRGERAYGEMLHGQVINRVIHQALRPEFKPGAWPPYVQLTHDCWAQDPSHRPTMDEVVSRIDSLVQLLDNGGDYGGLSEAAGASTCEAAAAGAQGVGGRGATEGAGIALGDPQGMGLQGQRDAAAAAAGPSRRDQQGGLV